jgi:hypothetical protein
VVTVKFMIVIFGWGHPPLLKQKGGWLVDVWIFFNTTKSVTIEKSGGSEIPKDSKRFQKIPAGLG